MVIIEWIMNSFSDYFHSQINEIINTITDIQSPAYTWIFCGFLLEFIEK